MYQLSILLPSGPNNAEKLARILTNFKETISDISKIEFVVCLDNTTNEVNIERNGNIVYVFAPPSQHRSTFFLQAWKASTGRFVLMANDDIIFKTKNWDTLIPYDKYPDDLVLFYFKDNQFNESFSCHPIWSRKVMEFEPTLLDPLYYITKCDNTIWDSHPGHRRHYLPEIEIEHIQTPYGPEWAPYYEMDNRTYWQGNLVGIRNKVRHWITAQTELYNANVLIGVVTAEYARRADFYDHLNAMERPKNSMNISVHGQSIANNRNKVVDNALVYGSSHVLFLDDDVIPKPELLYSLLKHDKDIVCALQCHRNFPHAPILFGEYVGKEGFRKLNFSNLTDGLVRVGAAGLGCVLIKTDVFKKMEAPWFRFGEFRKDQMAEDTGFFKRAGELGIEVYCDLGSQVGHIASMIVRPIKKHIGWIVDYDTNSQQGSVSFKGL